jgi:hypothetical protein
LGGVQVFLKEQKGEAMEAASDARGDISWRRYTLGHCGISFSNFLTILIFYFIVPPDIQEEVVWRDLKAEREFRFDVFLPTRSIAFEYDGEQHMKDTAHAGQQHHIKFVPLFCFPLFVVANHIAP